MTAILPRVLVGCFLSLTLAVGAAACGSPSSNTATPTSDGTGQFGEVGAGGQDAALPTNAPTPLPTPPAGEEPPAPTPTVKPTLILTLNPTLILPWPSPADCISHDPATATINYVPATQVWQVRTSTSTPLAFKREVDAKDGLALVKAYKKHCFIGRNNTRPDRARYIMDYWMDPVQPSPAIASPDCYPYKASDLNIAPETASGWLLKRGDSGSITYFDTKADAEKAIMVMKHFNQGCYIGRGYTGSDRLNYIADWFATA